MGKWRNRQKKKKEPGRTKYNFLGFLISEPKRLFQGLGVFKVIRTQQKDKTQEGSMNL